MRENGRKRIKKAKRGKKEAMEKEERRRHSGTETRDKKVEEEAERDE